MPPHDSANLPIYCMVDFSNQICRIKNPRSLAIGGLATQYPFILICWIQQISQFIVSFCFTFAHSKCPKFAVCKGRPSSYALRRLLTRLYQLYTKSLVNTNSFNTNFTNRHFQKVPIPHLTRTMKQKFLH